MPSWTSIGNAIVNLWGIGQTPEYDAIVVGAGPAGCTLAQTLIEGGLKVMLVERGDEPPEVSKKIEDSTKALISKEMIETLYSQPQGVKLTAPRVMGGGSSLNNGIWSDELCTWILDRIPYTEDEFFNCTEIEAAYDWSRDQMAPWPAGVENDTNADVYFNEFADVYENRSDFMVFPSRETIKVGSPRIVLNATWRTHSIFNPFTGIRFSADQLLDRFNSLLTVRTKTEVKKVLFDGDLGVPPDAADKVRDTPRARCVKFTSNEVVCVKRNGRIFLTAGALYTPAILMRSGIGENGIKSDLPDVGQHLSDKPTIGFTGFFEPEFEYEDLFTIATVHATKEIIVNDIVKTLLFQEYSFGQTGALVELSLQGLQNFPASARDGGVAAIFTTLANVCLKKQDDPGMFGIPTICADVVAVSDAGCDLRTVGLTAQVGDANSEGSVKLDAFGNLKIDVNYLDTPDDIEAFGTAVRTAFELYTARGVDPGGRSRSQRPCGDNATANCAAFDCPEIVKASGKILVDLLKVFKPIAYKSLPQGEASVVTPDYIEEILIESEGDDKKAGELLKPAVSGGNHYAGTAAIGKVVDNKFKVMGITGLYVADGASLPQTARINLMATVMMVARLAGLSTVQDNIADL